MRYLSFILYAMYLASGLLSKHNHTGMPIPHVIFLYVAVQYMKVIHEIAISVMLNIILSTFRDSPLGVDSYRWLVRLYHRGYVELTGFYCFTLITSARRLVDAG